MPTEPEAEDHGPLCYCRLCLNWPKDPPDPDEIERDELARPALAGKEGAK